MKRSRYSLGPIVGYHGCDRKVAESVLAGHTTLRPSDNDYDWLGPGVYFWVDSAERGLQWALESSKRAKSRIKEPFVIGAVMQPGLCLNLTDYGINEELRFAWQVLDTSMNATGTPMPVNTVRRDGVFVNRQLDCAVIRTLHQLREDQGLEAYDSVYGVFEEGAELFPGAGFRSKTHVQIALLNLNCIVGAPFRVPGVVC